MIKIGDSLPLFEYMKMLNVCILKGLNNVYKNYMLLVWEDTVFSYTFCDYVYYFSFIKDVIRSDKDKIILSFFICFLVYFF